VTKYSVKYVPSCHCEVAVGSRGNLKNCRVDSDQQNRDCFTPFAMTREGPSSQ